MAQNATVKDVDAKATVEAVKEKGRKVVSKATETVEKSVETAQELVSDVAERGTDEFQKLTQSGARFVRENPGTAIAGAIGVGILLGLVMRGRD